MLIINYHPDHLPSASQISHYTAQYQEEYTMEQNIDWIEGKGQILCAIPCSDGLVVIMRETGKGAMPPFNLQCISD